MFSTISYSKGASVIWMLEKFLALQGTDKLDAFDKAISSYLKSMFEYILTFFYIFLIIPSFAEYNGGNAKPIDLWNELAEFSEYPELVAAMQSYEMQPGYPVVSFAWEDPASEDSKQGTLVVSQQRYFLSGNSREIAASQNKKDLLYWIPLTLKASIEVTDSDLVKAHDESVEEKGWSTPTWKRKIEFDHAVEGCFKVCFICRTKLF